MGNHWTRKVEVDLFTDDSLLSPGTFDRLALSPDSPQLEPVLDQLTKADRACHDSCIYGNILSLFELYSYTVRIPIHFLLFPHTSNTSRKPKHHYPPNDSPTSGPSTVLISQEKIV
jgi:hypothetical protein